MTAPSYTIATLYRGDSCETYIALFEGGMSEQDEERIADQMQLRTEEGEALDWVGFCGVEVQHKRSEKLLFLSSTQGDLRLYTGGNNE